MQSHSTANKPSGGDPPEGPCFPLKPNTKIPATRHGFQDASSDPDQIARWQRECPRSNWGMPTGQASGVVVIDLDAKTGGLDSWAELVGIYGPVNTREVATPSRGAHLYFQTPEVELKSTAGQIAAGVDTRASRGYVVIPPSCIDGVAYTVVNDAPPVPVPDWLLALWPKVGEQRQRQHSPGDARVIFPPQSGGDLLNTPIPAG
jgi:Bifunctional DNA primase/polymerase, N-terminal